MAALGSPDDARARRGDDGRAGRARRGPARRRAHARRREPHPRRAPSSSSPRATTARPLRRSRRTRSRGTTRTRAGTGNDALALLERVIAAQAALVARWLGVGFVHGVMNTDNTSISGETIDYGPCAFLDEYDPEQDVQLDRPRRAATRSRTSRASRSGTSRGSPRRCCRSSPTTRTRPCASRRERLERFAPAFEAAHARVLRAKLGLGRARGGRGGPLLATDLLARLAAERVDYTLFFRRLCAVGGRRRRRRGDGGALRATRAPSTTGPSAGVRARRATASTPGRARRGDARAQTPPSSRATTGSRRPSRPPSAHADFGPFETLLDVVTRPYDDRADRPISRASPTRRRKTSASPRRSAGRDAQPAQGPTYSARGRRM